jgi:uncharacterized membrane protein
MKKSNFNQEEAYRVYHAYIEHAKKVVAGLPADDAEDIINEIDSHIFEAFNDAAYISSEKERIEMVVRNLGSPESYLKPIIAEKELHRAVDKYNAIGILKGIWSTILTGSRYALLSVMYIFILGAGVVIIAKILYPHKTGLFVNDGHFAGLGFMAQINSDATELLGYWLIPVMIVAIIVFYYFITFLLKQLLRMKKRVKNKCA